MNEEDGYGSPDESILDLHDLSMQVDRARQVLLESNPNSLDIAYKLLLQISSEYKKTTKQIRRLKLDISRKKRDAKRKDISLQGYENVNEKKMGKNPVQRVEDSLVQSQVSEPEGFTHADILDPNYSSISDNNSSNGMNGNGSSSITNNSVQR